ncbi:MAG: TIGR02996 domain-containing protein [Kofleriaceae bacterium]
MDTGELEQRLRADPSDHETWRVYADSLLERGDPRGEWIHVELKGGYAKPHPIDGMEIMASKCGFPTSVKVAWGNAAIDQLRQLPFVSELRIVAPNRVSIDEFEDEDEGGPRPLEGMAWFEAIDLAQITSLNLAYVELRAAGAAIVSRWTQLVQLDLRYARIGDPGVAALAPLVNLERLYLQRNDLTPAAIPVLAKLPKLIELDLRYNNVGAVPLKISGLRTDGNAAMGAIR